MSLAHFSGALISGGLSHGRCHRGQCHDSALQSGDDEHDPASSLTRAELGANLGDGIHKAKAVNQWLETHPRFALLWLTTYGPRANPSERACGDVHDKCTRNHTRNAYAMWSAMSSVTDARTDRGAPSCRSSMRPPRSRLLSCASRPSNKPRLPHECTNLMHSDLACAGWAHSPLPNGGQQRGADGRGSPACACVWLWHSQSAT
jgi:hypothetical protein